MCSDRYSNGQNGLRGALILMAVATVFACRSPSVVTNASSDRAGNGSGSAGGSGGRTQDAAIRVPDAAQMGSAPDMASCIPTTCQPAGGQYCGPIGDGCGRTLDCGDCPAGSTCGGGGTPGVCGTPPDPACTPITCEQMGGRLCGQVGNGCGEALDCGDCPAGLTCGASIANVCGNGQGQNPVGCDNLCLQQVKCAPGQKTTVTGTVYAPTPPRFGAADPLYNALVYVPNRPLEPFAPGVACDQCGTPVSGAPLTNTLSAADGTFVLDNVPVGENIPLVIQIGRWRREVTIPKVTACGNTALPAELTRLPRTKSEGNIPQMAIATGLFDPFECVLRKIGIDEAEFTPPDQDGRVHVYSYQGLTLRGGQVPAGGRLVQNPDRLDDYDMVLLPCDDDSMKLASELSSLRGYTDKGGRLFLTDFSYSWLKDGGAFEGTGQWLAQSDSVGEDFQTRVDETFPKGRAFADWLLAVGASTQRGLLPIHDEYFGTSYFDGVVAPTQRWLYTEAPIRTVQHFTFNTPIGAPEDQQCGRVVFSTFHVSDGADLFGSQFFPDGCSNEPMTPQEKALEFMLFDAGACVQPDKDPPRVFQPPPPAPPPPPQVID